ncbi:glycoside hydrolase [Massarina eburnea CBS 473.64]|uniref:Glycoside hydrolase n=1 Tax=Massarina eburnea CBS 473.64 TaxID=1395130 RepID=A0A6A6S648_9PLEO|nr:glycoside hydrolase [Massarina eburnea CBS 473.64]
MKLGTLASIVVGVFFVGIAAGHPLNVKRVIETEVVYVTETVADAVVYVDDKGIPYSTSTVARVTSIPTLQVSTTLAASSTPVPTSTSLASFVTPTPVPTEPGFYEPKPKPKPVPSPSTSQAPAPPVEPSFVTKTVPESSIAPEPKPSVNANGQFPLGITYDTFKGSVGNTQCKTADEMNAEFDKMKSFGIVRIYGNDCGVIPIAVQQAKKNGQKVMAGIYSPNQAVSDVVNALSDAVKQFNNGDWSIISLVSVENERVNAHVITVSSAVDTVTQARKALESVGYNGPIGPVETVPALVDNPSLCDQADMALVNIHAFFDPNTKAEDAGPFVKSEVERVKKACPNKRVIVTESGWPSQGSGHDKAVVSKDAQRAAIDSIKASFDHDLFLFNAFDSPWKSDDASTFNSERFWGIL